MTRGGNGLTAAILGPTEVALFENLYAAYAVEARDLALGFVGDPADAADVMHTAYLELLRQLLGGRRWPEPAEARAAVLRNTRWAALNFLRRQRRRREVGLDRTTATEQPATDEWARSEVRSLCEHLVAQLRARDQDAIQLRYLKGLSNSEAGEVLGITEKAFELRLARAIKRARHLAGSLGMLQILVAFRCRMADRFRDVARESAARLRHALLATACVGAVVGIVGKQAGLTVGRMGAAETRDQSVAAAVARTDVSETIEDTTFFDALALRAGAARTVLALGHGAQCACWLVWRSADGGATWQSTPGPSSRSSTARLDVGPRYPADPRIWILDSDGRVVMVADGFGNPFVSASSRQAMAGGATHATRCALAHQLPFCFGHSSPDGGASGLVLTTGPAQLMYFAPLGGIRSSADGGATWKLIGP